MLPSRGRTGTELQPQTSDNRGWPLIPALVRPTRQDATTQRPVPSSQPDAAGTPVTEIGSRKSRSGEGRPCAGGENAIWYEALIALP